jgi:AcrR family transcriptional regulator
MKYNKNTEEIILQTALALFVSKGYHGTSINDIMKKVNLTKGALYAHYKSKSALLFKILDKYETKYIDQMIKETTEHPGNIVEKFHYSWNFSAKFAVGNRDLCVFLAFLTTELNTDTDFLYSLKMVYRKHTKFIGSLISQGIRQGVLKEDLDPELASLSYMAMHDGSLHQWVLNRDHIDVGEFVKTFQNIFMEGLAK